jgi:hypothetical protein
MSFNSLLILSLLITLPFVFSATNGQCSGRNGICVSTATCKSYGGTSYAGYCPYDPADIKCCDNIKCNASGGSGDCKFTSQCGGTTYSGLCPGGSDFKCCVGGGGGSSGNGDKYTVAKEVYNFFKGKGWTKNAICGMLGNMERESGLKPDINEYGGGGGYGLVQWTPGSNLKNWANARGLNYRLTKTQCLKIQDEFENGGQYYKTNSCPLTFSQFSKSTESPEYLAACFMYNYERPGVQALNDRKTYARNWYNYF